MELRASAPISENRHDGDFGFGAGQRALPAVSRDVDQSPQRDRSYKRFLANKLYATFNFDGCPVVVDFVPIRKTCPRFCGGTRLVVAERRERPVNILFSAGEGWANRL